VQLVGRAQLCHDASDLTPSHLVDQLTRLCMTASTNLYLQLALFPGWL